MSLKGKLVAEIEVITDADVFHELVRYRPHHIATLSPDNIQGCDLHEGEFGAIGSVILYNYTHDGEKKVAKVIVDVIDGAKKNVTYKLIEGDLMELYKTFIITVHIETMGESNLISWTFDFLKVTSSVPFPFTLMEVCLNIGKDIEAHHLK